MKEPENVTAIIATRHNMIIATILQWNTVASRSGSNYSSRCKFRFTFAQTQFHTHIQAIYTNYKNKSLLCIANKGP